MISGADKAFIIGLFIIIGGCTANNYIDKAYDTCIKPTPYQELGVTK